MTKLEQLHSTPELLAQYKAWLKDPMTTFAREASEEIHRAVMPDVSQMMKPIETLAALFAEQAGVGAGMRTMVSLDRMNPEDHRDVGMDWETKGD